jgi:hypothetical protein
MPAKRIANEVQRQESNRMRRNTNGIVVVVPRSYAKPKFTSKHGCQSPLFSLVNRHRRLVGVEPNPGPPRYRAGSRSVRVKARKLWLVDPAYQKFLNWIHSKPRLDPSPVQMPAPRLVGIEPNPGPPKSAPKLKKLRLLGKGGVVGLSGGKSQKERPEDIIRRVEAESLARINAAASTHSSLVAADRAKRRSALSSLGETVGNAFGVGELGKTAGSLLGSVFDLFSGKGGETKNMTYKQRAATYSRVAKQRGLPRLSTIGNNSRGTPVHLSSTPIKITSKLGKNWTYINDNNFVLEIVASTTDQDLLIAVNPGYYPTSSGQAYPLWPTLVGTGGGFQKWIDDQIVLGYEEACKSLALTEPLPMITILSVTDLDATMLSGEVALLAESLAVSFPADEDEWIPLECDPSMANCPCYEVRTDAVGIQSRRKRVLGDPASGSSTELRSCDPCYIQVHIPATTAVAAGTVLGQLWQTSKLQFAESRLNPIIYDSEGILVSNSGPDACFYRANANLGSKAFTTDSNIQNGISAYYPTAGMPQSNCLPTFFGGGGNEQFTLTCGTAVPSIPSPPSTFLPGSYEISMVYATTYSNVSNLSMVSSFDPVVTLGGSAALTPWCVTATGSNTTPSVYSNAATVATPVAYEAAYRTYTLGVQLIAPGDSVTVDVHDAVWLNTYACYFQLQVRQLYDGKGNTPVTQRSVPPCMVRGRSKMLLKACPSAATKPDATIGTSASAPPPIQPRRAITSEAQPTTSSTSLEVLEARLKMLEDQTDRDSEYDQVKPAYIRVQEHPLTKSTVDLIGELASRMKPVASQ